MFDNLLKVQALAMQNFVQEQEETRPAPREHLILLSSPSAPLPEHDEVPPANPSSFFFDQTEEAQMEVLAEILHEIHVFTLIAEREECTISSIAYLLGYGIFSSIAF
jgi:hypothetical protein